jgi:hypothetical protein
VCPAGRGVAIPKIAEVELVQRTRDLYDAIGAENQAPSFHRDAAELWTG